MTAPRFEGDPPTHFVSPLLEDAGVPHLFTTRHFPGVTAFRDPHPPLGDPARPLLDANGLARSPAAFLKQMHGAKVIQACRGGLAGEADAIVTDTPGLPVAVVPAGRVPARPPAPARPRPASRRGARGGEDRCTRWRGPRCTRSWRRGPGPGSCSPRWDRPSGRAATRWTSPSSPSSTGPFRVGGAPG